MVRVLAFSYLFLGRAFTANNRPLATRSLVAMSSGCDDGVCVPKNAAKKADASVESASTTNQRSSTHIKIDIISDTMCPWCWVGKRNLEEALRCNPNVTADVTWFPYFLDRNLPETGKRVRDYYRDNYGDAMAGERMKPALVQAGKKCGIDFESHYVHMERYRPTIKSHRLVA